MTWKCVLRIKSKKYNTTFSSYCTLFTLGDKSPNQNTKLQKRQDTRGLGWLSGKVVASQVSGQESESWSNPWVLSSGGAALLFGLWHNTASCVTSSKQTVIPSYNSSTTTKERQGINSKNLVGPYNQVPSSSKSIPINQLSVNQSSTPVNLITMVLWEAIPGYAKGLLLALHLGITPEGLRRHEMPDIKLRLAEYKASALSTILF